MRRRVYLTVAAVLVGVAPWLHGQDRKAEIQKSLSSQFTLTQTTADKSDVAAAGAVLVLHKDGLVMYSTANLIPPQSTYKKGKITRNVWGKNWARDLGNQMANQSPDIEQRKFVAGETFWVTKVDVKDDGIVFGLYSDPYDGVHYFGELKFPFSKGRAPPVDDVLQTIEEVLTVQPADNSSPDGAPPENATSEIAPAPPTENAFPEIAPPPPPADAISPPKTIVLGQTKDQVVATFGHPRGSYTPPHSRGTEIYYYYNPAMKVTFVNGKVTDVQ